MTVSAPDMQGRRLAAVAVFGTGLGLFALLAGLAVALAAGGSERLEGLLLGILAAPGALLVRWGEASPLALRVALALAGAALGAALAHRGKALSACAVALSVAAAGRVVPPILPGMLAAGAAAGALLVSLRSGGSRGCGGVEPLPERLAIAPASLAVPLAIAAVLRFTALDTHPDGFSQHAVVHHSDTTYRVLHELPRALRERGWGGGRELLADVALHDQFGPMSILSAAGFQLLGVGFREARLWSAVFGVFTVLPAFWAGAWLFGRGTGFVFALLLAASPWHLTLSRYGDLEHVLSPMQLLLTLAAYAAALRTDRVVAWLLAGVCLGLAFYVYAANLFLPAVVLLHAAGHGALRLLRPPRTWRGLKSILLLAGFALLAYAPLRAMRESPFVRTGYAQAGTTRSWATLRGAAAAEAGQLFRHSTDPWFEKAGGGLGATEAVLLLPGVLLLGGALARRAGASLILLALPLAFVPSVVAPDVSFRRLYPFACLAILVAAFALAELHAAARGVPWLRWVAGPGLALAVSSGAFIAFHRTLVYAETSALPHTARARVTRPLLGTGLVALVAPEQEHDDVRRYVRFGAYRRLRELGAPGDGSGVFYEVVTPEGLAPLLARPLRTRLTVVLEDWMLGGPGASPEWLAVLRKRSTTPEGEIYRDTAGRPVLRIFRVRPSG